jgi:RNA polymerase sigma factor (sigma-70 family)
VETRNRVWKPRGERSRDEAERLVDENQGLVHHMLRQRWNVPGGRQRLARVGEDRALQEGYLALWRAAEDYDPGYVSPRTGRGVKFNTYACKCIARALHQLEVKGSYRFEGGWFGGRKFCRSDRTPVVAQMPLVGPHPGGFYDGGGAEWDPPAPGPTPAGLAEASEPDAISRELRRAVDGLELRLAVIIRGRFLLDPPATLSQLGRELHVTRERVRQLQAKALEILRGRVAT